MPIANDPRARLLKAQSVHDAAAVPPGPITWGLTTTRADASTLTGAGIKIAVLDSGFDLGHPDFAGRGIVTQDLVGGGFNDVYGHGTHCTGTAGGPRMSAKGTRYGIACNASLYAGRVLDDTGYGSKLQVRAGIDWALSQGCHIITLSAGGAWFIGQPVFDPDYEADAQRALAQGCLIIVAAGNDFNDPSAYGAVSAPGNSPSVLTVASVDSNLATADFSNRIVPEAPGVKGPDVAAPGVSIFSSWPANSYNTISGTSQATPHVAGIAAMYAQSDPTLRGAALKAKIIATCKPLPQSKDEVGAGLVQAP